MVEWENEEISTETLLDIPAENGIFNTLGWKCFKSIAMREKTYTQMVNFQFCP
jgi:hypothetical protein